MYVVLIILEIGVVIGFLGNYLIDRGVKWLMKKGEVVTFSDWEEK